MQQCLMCGHEMEHETRDVLYDWSGLEDVLLCDVGVWVCPECGEEEVVIPAVAQLQQLLATIVMRKRGLLKGNEIRFLRKHLGWSSTDFAKRMGVRPETVSRWEKDKQAISNTHDRLIRLLVKCENQVDDYRTEEIELADAAPARTSEPRRVSVKDKEWAVAC